MANVRLLPPLLASIALAACVADGQTGQPGPTVSTVSTAAPGNDPLLFSAAAITEGELKTAEMAEGGKFFATMREDKGPDLLRLWRIEGDDARLVAKTRVDNNVGWKMAVRPDGSQVAIAHAVQKAQLFENAKTVSELLVWVVGSDEKKVVLTSEGHHSTCGLTYFRQGNSLVGCWRVKNKWIVYTQDVQADGKGGPVTQRKLPWPFVPHAFGPLGADGFQAEGRNDGDAFTGRGGLIYPAVISFRTGDKTIRSDVTEGHWQAGYLGDGKRLLARDRETLSIMVSGQKTPVAAVPARRLTQISREDRLLKSGRAGLMFGLSHTDGLSAYVVGDKAVGEAARNTDAKAWYAFAVLDGGDEAVALSDEGIRRLKVTPERRRAALAYAEGLDMMHSGFGGLGADKIIQAFETDPSYAGKNVAYPMIHNWPELFTESFEGAVKAAPADAGRLFLAIHRITAAKDGDGRRDAAYSIISLAYHGLFALRAGQPGIARQSLAVLRRLVDKLAREGEVKANKANIWPDLLEAMNMADEGNLDEAYAFLVKQGGLVRDGYPYAAGHVLEFTEVFAPLLRDRAKIAYLTGKPESEVRVSTGTGTSKPEPTAYPDVNGTMIAPVLAPSAAEPPSSSVPAASSGPAPSGPAAGQVLD